MEILVSGDNHKVSNLVFSFCMSECLDRTRDTQMSMFHCFPRPHCLLRQQAPVGLVYHFIMQLQAVSTFTKPVLYHLWLCSIIHKATWHFFLQSGHLNWCTQHHSVEEGEPLHSGEFSVPYNKSLFIF